MTGKRHQKRRKFVLFLIQVKRRLVFTRIQMNYTFILNKTWNIHRKFRGYLFLYKKERKIGRIF